MSPTVEDDEFMNDCLEDMICDIGVDAFKKAHVEDTLQIDLEDSLHPDVNFLQECHMCWDYLILRQWMGGRMKVSMNFLNCCKKCFQKVTRC